jgi:hypothetical protein
VRVHTDDQADVLNRQLNARAFTTGQDIFFQRGAYNPASESGQKVIDHELAHVVQQSSGRVSGGGSMAVRPAADAFEQEADKGSGVVAGPLPPAPSPIQRCKDKKRERKDLYIKKQFQPSPLGSALSFAAKAVAPVVNFVAPDTELSHALNTGVWDAGGTILAQAAAAGPPPRAALAQAERLRAVGLVGQSAPAAAAAPAVTPAQLALLREAGLAAPAAGHHHHAAAAAPAVTPAQRALLREAGLI